MAEFEHEEQTDFLIEKIKERPINRKKLLRRTIITASMAVIFGLIACVTFSVLEPVISNLLYPEEEYSIVIFPEDNRTEEMQPEEMLSEKLDAMQKDEDLEELQEETEHLKELITQSSLSIENYEQLYSSMNHYVQLLQKHVVKITGISEDTDWISEAESGLSRETSGVVVAHTMREIVILTDYESIKDAERLSVSFWNGYQIDAQIMNYHTPSDLAVIYVNNNAIVKSALEDENLAVHFDVTKKENTEGTPVVAMGNPMGDFGSVGYGMITSDNYIKSEVDGNYSLLCTDMYGSKDGGGVLFNLKGQVVGIITPNPNKDMSNLVTAYSIFDMKALINRLSQKNTMPYVGIYGADVPADAKTLYGVPGGAYISDVDMESPAMLAGVQTGDIITYFNGYSVGSFVQYASALNKTQSGQEVEMKVMRQYQEEYKEMTFTITIGELK